MCAVSFSSIPPGSYMPTCKYDNHWKSFHMCLLWLKVWCAEPTRQNNPSQVAPDRCLFTLIQMMRQLSRCSFIYLMKQKYRLLLICLACSKEQLWTLPTSLQLLCLRGLSRRRASSLAFSAVYFYAFQMYCDCLA